MKFSMRRVLAFAGIALFLLVLIMGYFTNKSAQQKSGDEIYTLRGGKFVDGKFGKGFLAAKKGDKFVLPTKGALKREEGTIEMWVRHVLPKEKRPDWAPLFTVMLEPYTVNVLEARGLIVQLMEHSKKIAFILGRFGDERNVLEASNLDWEAGEDHHVAVSWGKKGMHIYVDGRQMAKNDYTGSLPSLHEKMGVGCYAANWIQEPAAAVIDDLRISGVQRSEKEIAQTFQANKPVDMDDRTLLIARFDDQQIVSLPHRRYGETPEKETAEGEGRKEERVKSELPKNRSSYMGFTPSSYDLAPEADRWTYQFIENHGDIIGQHFSDGIPWPEALNKSPYHPNVENKIKERIQGTNRNKLKTFLYITPLNTGSKELAGYWEKESTMKRPREWKDKKIDDPDVIKAYINFSRDMIHRFRPQFMAYGIEVNALYKEQPKEWPRFVKLAKEVYTTLKAENPNLPIFVSLYLDYFLNDERKQREAISQILPYTDYLAISTYPYLDQADPNKLRKDHFSKIVSLAPNKPFAVAETGYVAKDLDAFGLKVPGNEEWQNDYLKFLLSECNKLNAKFVIWFVPRDYEPFFQKIKAMKVGKQLEDLFKIWKDTGLLDDKGNQRKSFHTWEQWLKLPKRG